MKQTMMNTAAGVLAAVLLGGAGLAWADGFDPWLADGLNKQIQQNREAQQQPTYSGPTAAEIRAWEQREAKVQAEIAELRRTPFYGALALDLSSNSLGWSGGYYSEQRAREEALKNCLSSNCKVVRVFSNTCGVLVLPARGARSESDVFVGIDKNDRQAAAKARQACESREGAGNCRFSAVETRHGTAFCTGYDYSSYNQR
ncbi:DUF4189 domain-containing protein [Eikenella sp. NML01-A-086]|uniref:DUF4189 domain-containing protein n=1 Tax=Eikenella sp. NML01-A-086 TaxID=1795826 RepID=UPI0007DEB6FA|nr:DUF4189 domain-containing protein [Eikenella sp. NML01-A-086]OAM28928.1 hypothetical protein A7P94_02690 [Eikenella sp. NML01-A-086]